MSPLISIALASESGKVADHLIHELPVVVLSPHNRCNCRCMMCDIWRIQEERSIRPDDLARHMAAFRELGVRWVVFSGGEPQMNRDWPVLAGMLRAEGIRLTILTAGLLLESEAELVASCVDDIIVSLDGPRDLHNRIRRVPQAFERIEAGVRALRRHNPGMAVRTRCTVQKANHQALCETVQAAKQLDANAISFLAADGVSEAFNREGGWSADQQRRVMLIEEEAQQLEIEVERLISTHSEDLESGFISENAGKLRKIVLHFRAHLGQMQDIAPRCNAPWVSTVIDAQGEVRPCFFHAPLGNIYAQSLPEILNGERALQFRAGLDVATNPICRKCVCSLYLAPELP